MKKRSFWYMGQDSNVYTIDLARIQNISLSEKDIPSGLNVKERLTMMAIDKKWIISGAIGLISLGTTAVAAVKKHRKKKKTEAIQSAMKKSLKETSAEDSAFGKFLTEHPAEADAMLEQMAEKMADMNDEDFEKLVFNVQVDGEEIIGMDVGTGA